MRALGRWWLDQTVSSESDGGTDTYTHVPGGTEAPDSSAARATAGDAEEGLGARGWVLVGVVFVATVVCPAIVYLYPAVLSDHVSFRFAMLAVPFLPALLLGGAAVWAMAARR